MSEYKMGLLGPGWRYVLYLVPFLFIYSLISNEA